MAMALQMKTYPQIVIRRTFFFLSNATGPSMRISKVIRMIMSDG